MAVLGTEYVASSVTTHPDAAEDTIVATTEQIAHPDAAIRPAESSSATEMEIAAIEATNANSADPQAEAVPQSTEREQQQAALEQVSLDLSRMVEHTDGNVTLTIKPSVVDVALSKVIAPEGVEVRLDSAIGLITVQGSKDAVAAYMQELNLMLPPEAAQHFYLKVTVASDMSGIVSPLHYRMKVSASGEEHGRTLSSVSHSRGSTPEDAMLERAQEHNAPTSPLARDTESPQNLASTLSIQQKPMEKASSFLYDDVRHQAEPSSSGAVPSSASGTSPATPAGQDPEVPIPPRASLPEPSLPEPARNPGNHTPVQDSLIPDQNVYAGGALAYDTSGHFSDVDVGDSLAFYATLADGSPLPSWLSIDPVTGVLTGAPGVAEIGTVNVIVRANDQVSGVYSTAFAVTVDNNPPVQDSAVPDQGLYAGDPLAYDVTGHFSDADGDTLTYSATLSGGGALPGWLSIDPTTGILSGTPAGGDIGTLSVVVVVDDGTTILQSAAFDVQVNNTAPVQDSAILSQLAVTNTLWSYDASAHFSDPDGHSLTYSATLDDDSALPAWLSIDPATGILSGTPAGGDTGDIDMKVTVDDGTDTLAGGSFTLTIGNFDVIGTDGDDSMTGASNQLIAAGAGDDTIGGWYNYSTVYGGDGDDVISNMHRGIAYGEAGNDHIIAGIYGTLDGGDGNDTLDGSSYWNIFYGGADADTMTGGGGADQFRYTDASESTTAAQDVITDFNGAEGDKIVLEADDFPGVTGMVNGAPDANNIGYSFDGTHTTLTAANGWSVKLENTNEAVIFLDTAGVNDTILGGDGDESMIGSSDGLILAGAGDDTVSGSNYDTVYGGDGDDTVSTTRASAYGEDGDDYMTITRWGTLEGGDGNDTLVGSTNDGNTFVGGADADTMTGGGGADQFRYTDPSESTTAAQDVITDYEDGSDRIDLSALGIGFGDLTISLGSGDTLVEDLGSGLSIRLTGDHTADLDAGDFIF